LIIDDFDWPSTAFVIVGLGCFAAQSLIKK
jgi:hypothetical protein